MLYTLESVRDSMTIGFIGFGNMGKVLSESLRKFSDTQTEIIISDKDYSKIEEAKKAGFKTDNNKEVFLKSDIVFLCIKPKDLISSLEEIKQMIKEADEKSKNIIKKKTIVSILAGIRISKIIDALGIEIPIIRIMPNTPTLVGEGAFGIYFSENVEETPKNFVMNFLNKVGKTVVVENEDLMDTITGLSGSGPAYIFMVIQALADGGVRMGLSRKDALILSAQTVLGSAKMVLENIGKLHPEELKDMVMSPGGTTAEGIKALEENKIRFAFIKAVEEATKKSKELSK